MPSRSEYIFRPAWWVPGAHGQTIWSKFFRHRPELPLRLEQWETPDGDFVEVQRLDAPRGRPRLLMLHGLEGTIRSHYVAGFFAEAVRRGWAADLLLFRGCGSRPNRAPRFYHSGDTADVAFVLDRIVTEHADAPVLLAGVSLGGNVLLKYLGEQGVRLSPAVRGAAAVSVPFDLELGCLNISTGFSRVYDLHFLRSLRRKAMAKLEAYPGLFDEEKLREAQSLYDFDDVVTAPVHGFRDAHDYYDRSSSIRWISRIERSTFLLSAEDDPFLPPEVLDRVREIAKRTPALSVEFPRHGGHVGFIQGAIPWRPSFYAEWRACEFLASTLV